MVIQLSYPGLWQWESSVSEFGDYRQNDSLLQSHDLPPWRFL